MDKVCCEMSVPKNETLIPQCPLIWTLTTILVGDVNE
jgi:hypothetical protein